MHSFFRFICNTIAVTTLIITSIANAQNHTHHNHDAHDHGLAQITLAIDVNTILINLVAPAHSLIGFEHRAHTPKEITTVHNLKKSLANNKLVLALPKAGCTLIESKIETGELLAVDESKQPPHNSHSKHNEITVSYNLRCPQLANVSTASVHLFEYFPEIEEINVLWITESQQGAASLTAQDNIISWQ
jgi:hypothetical protein